MEPPIKPFESWGVEPRFDGWKPKVWSGHHALQIDECLQTKRRRTPRDLRGDFELLEQPSPVKFAVLVDDWFERCWLDHNRAYSLLHDRLLRYRRRGYIKGSASRWSSDDGT